jgi:probable biosynthetic protein (TIGR04099 family)
MHQLQDTAYVAGMPHLAYSGLSESWLLKECGQRHWAGIAAIHGLHVPEFSDVSGRQAYAAFTAISVTNAALDDIGEHGRFEISTRVQEAGRSQYYSRHQLGTGGRGGATVEMISAFVQRLEQGNNQSVTRALVGKEVRQAPRLDGSLARDASVLLQASKSFRSSGHDICRDLRLEKNASPQDYVFLPCPAADFNGANFMYFATFQTLVERAEWFWFRRSDLPQLAERQLYFYGNLNIGDMVRIRLLAHRNDTHLAHWCGVFRESDNVKIADVVTLKGPHRHPEI